MSNEQIQCCGQCRFWKEVDSGAGEGECRRYAPRSVIIRSANDEVAIVGEDPARYAVWPVTFVEEWCGEFQPLPLSQSSQVIKPEGQKTRE